MKEPENQHQALLRIVNTLGVILRRLDEPVGSYEWIKLLEDPGVRSMPLKQLLALSAPCEVCQSARDYILKTAQPDSARSRGS